MNHQKTNTHWKNHPWQETEVCQWPWKPLQSGYVCRCSFLSYILHLKKENSRLSKFRKWRRLKENQIQGVTPIMASISWAEFLPSVVTVGEKRQHYDRITDANTLNVNLFIIFLFFFSVPGIPEAWRNLQVSDVMMVAGSDLMLVNKTALLFYRFWFGVALCYTAHWG